MGPPGLKDTAGHKTETDLQPLGNTRRVYFLRTTRDNRSPMLQIK